MDGKLITLEGIDGAGKTTQCRRIVSWLRERGLEVVATREPGGSARGERLRELLALEWLPESELLLLFSARWDHLKERILPALARGAFVVCDRFLDSSYAYQGFGRGIPLERLDWLSSWLAPRRPDLTFWLDLPVEEALSRLSGREERSLFEEPLFLERVREGYRWLWRRAPERIVRIDASRRPEEVSREIEGVLERWLKKVL